MKRIALSVLAVIVIADTTFAQTFVSESSCLASAPDCTCIDGQFLQLYRDQQRKGQSSWLSVATSVPGPANTTAAIAQFQAGFTDEPRISSKFTSACPNSNVAQVAGVDSSGASVLDSCFCTTFCKDIVQSTIDHEHMHPPTLVVGFLSNLPTQFACKVSKALQPMCDTADAVTLVQSEILSYQAGISTLNKAINRLANNADVQCTWTPLTVTALRTAPPTEIPESIWQRLAMLAERFWNGITA